MKLLAPMLLLLPFLFLMDMGFYILATSGIGTGLMLMAYDAVPVRPMDGRRVWGWSKGLAVMMLVIGLVILFAWQMTLLPKLYYYLLGVAGLAGFIGAGVYVFRTRRGERPGPVPSVAWDR